MYRVEDKFMCSKQDLLILQTRLQSVLRPDVNQYSDMGYKVTSVYFDDIYDTHLNDTIDGKRHRKKYRIRVYNDSFETIKLEVKCKRDSKVFKYSRKISYEDMKCLLDGQCIEDIHPSLDSAVTLFNLEIAQKVLKPKVIIEYERKAYVYDAGNVRITFDRNVRASKDYQGFLDGNRAFYTPVNGLQDVLEVKYDEFLPGFIGRLLENGKMNQIAFSKYRLGREVLGE